MDMRSFFESRLREHGNRAQALDWSERGQQIRFQVLTQVGSLEGRTILDLGSGLGHFYRFLSEQLREFEYTGYELSPLLVEAAHASFPSAKFEVHDVLTEEIDSNYDFVMSSGMLNLETGENEREMCSLIKKAWNACSIGVGINMLSRWAGRDEPGRHFYDPSAFLLYARQLTPRVVLRHDYLPHDFTLFLYREARA